MAFEKIDLYIGLMINGIFTGLGTAVGTYLAQNKIIKRLENLEKSFVSDLRKDLNTARQEIPSTT